ncbi:MAG: metal ABC transporter permease [Desulfurococcales archaeon]|nr:metal ABC transporter permease [Desulfurococcales archaeon]
MRIQAIIAFTVILSAIITGTSAYPWEWTATMLGAGLAYGALSPLLHSRRLLFIAGAAPHAALAAASLGVVAGGLLGVDHNIASMLIGFLMIYSAGYAAYKGMDPDVAAALLAGFTASLSIIGLYIASRMGLQLSGVILGDPLLASSIEALAVLVIGVIIFLASLLIARKAAYIGVDRDDALISGSRVWLYDLVLYSIIAVSTVGLITVVGFILEHVLLLIPGALILPFVRGSRVMVLTGGMIGAGFSLAGLMASTTLSIPPAAATGLLMMAGYGVALYRSGVWRGG